MPMSVGMFSGQTPWHSPLAWLPPHLPLCLPLLEPDTFKIVPQSSPSLELDTLKIIPWSSPQSSCAAGAHDELSLRTIPEIMFEKCHWPSFFIQLKLFIWYWPVEYVSSWTCKRFFKNIVVSLLKLVELFLQLKSDSEMFKFPNAKTNIYTKHN